MTSISRALTLFPFLCVSLGAQSHPSKCDHRHLSDGTIVWDCFHASRRPDRAATESAITAPPPTAFFGVETVLDQWKADDRVFYRVRSNGCTDASSFSFEIGKSIPARLLLARESRDSCKASLPQGTVVSFTYEELGFLSADDVVLANPTTLSSR